MPHNPHREARKSPRLRGYDYAQEGAYFVTICTHRREHLFGAVVDGEMHCNPFGDVVWACWEAIPAHFPHVEIDAFIAMPNHVHGILVITETPVSSVGARHASPVQSVPRPIESKSGSLSTVVGAFKSAATKQINSLRGTRGAVVWQRSFHDVIIRSEYTLSVLRAYVATNAEKWSADRYFA